VCDAINLYAIPTAISIVVFVSFMSYLLLYVRRTEARDGVILATSFVNAWALGEFIMRASDNETLALVGSKLFLNIGIGLLGPTVLYLVMLVTERTKPFKGILIFIAFYLVPIWVIVARAGTEWVQAGVTKNYWGYSDLLSEPLSYPYYIIMISFYIIALILLAQRYATTEGNNKQISLLMFLGILFPLVVTISTDIFLPAVNIHIPEMAVPSCLFLIGALYISLKKYELFEIKPVSEKKAASGKKGLSVQEEPVKDLPGGKMYYFAETKPELTLKVFACLVTHGHQGLGIIRLSPPKFRELTGLETTPVIWLSSQENTSIKTLNPSAISRLFVTVSEFLKSAERPVILLEGIEALIFTNNFREVMGFIASVYEKVAISEGVIIIPISRPTMNESEWTLLTRHMDDLAQFMSEPKDA
jgi:hypothetical protein